jgi:hypothetical protein
MQDENNKAIFLNTNKPLKAREESISINESEDITLKGRKNHKSGKGYKPRIM